MKLTVGRLTPILIAGLVIGLLEVALAASFATLIFPGELAIYVPRVVGFALVGTVLAGLVLTLLTSQPGIVAGPQDVPAAFMAVVVAGIVVTMPTNAATEETFLTAVAAIAVTTLLTAIFMLALGFFKLGALVRFLPYPVIGGFLAGTGWLLVTGAFATMVDVPQGSTLLSVLIQPESSAYWVPGLILALIMLVLLRRIDHFLLLPALVIGGILLFYLFAWLSGMSLAELSDQGWLLGPFPPGGLWQPLMPADLGQVNWSVIAAQLPSMISIFLVSSVVLLLNISGLELVANQDMDINRELEAAGAANFASSFMFGLINYQYLSLSTLSFRSGTYSRLIGLIAALLCLLVLFFGGALLSLVPGLVISALLLYLGLEFLYEWVIESWSKMPKIDYLIIVIILLVTAAIGFIEAVGLGLIVAIVLFVVGYSRIDVVRNELTETTYQSRISRSRQQRKILAQEGEQILILELQGFIFFGTADNLLKRIRQRIEDPEQPRPRYVQLDFRRVTGLDSTALLSFSRMQQLAKSQEFSLLYTGAIPQVQRQLKQSIAVEGEDDLHFAHTLEQGIEWCENQILQQAGFDVDEKPPTLSEQLAAILPDAQDLEEILRYFDEMDVEPGYRLIRQGEPAHDLFFIEEGQVTVELELEDGSPVRLETMGGGVLGEIGFYLGYDRTASVIVDVQSRIYRLTRSNMRRMEKENPTAAANMHRLIVHLLSERVAHLVKAVNALER